MEERTYIAIDLKSFYASVECVERGLDPLDANLVVADVSRTEKTICLAVSPSLKAYGIPGRPRLFEVIQKVDEINRGRLNKAPGHVFAGSSFSASELNANPGYALSYITAPPQMGRYIDVSTKVYSVYLKYISPEDIHVYSIDEVFIDATQYLGLYGMTARELAMQIVSDVLKETGVTATAGIGTNLFLCKVAMDVVAKHLPADTDGVRIAALDEKSYRRKLWAHKPITDIWRVGRGYAMRLKPYGITTMGDIARCSVEDEDLLYRLFGKNAELLIDHAWGYEPCTISDIKSYRPGSASLSQGQVLHEPYTYEKARLVVKEMLDLLALDLAAKNLMAAQIVLTIGYDKANLADEESRAAYKGDITFDVYGRSIPRHARGAVNLSGFTSSSRRITAAGAALFDRITDKCLLIRRINVAACRIGEHGTADAVPENAEFHDTLCKDGQLSLFDFGLPDAPQTADTGYSSHNIPSGQEERMQQAVLSIKKRFGKNALLKGMNLEEGATAMSRNMQIGGHRK